MANLFKLKAWVRYDGKGRLVGGGPILQADKPKNGDWVEIPFYEYCCQTTSTTTTIAPTTTTTTTAPPVYERASTIQFAPISFRGGTFANKAAMWTGNTVANVTATNPTYQLSGIKGNVSLELTVFRGERYSNNYLATLSSTPDVVVPTYTTTDSGGNPILGTLQDFYEYAKKITTNTFLSTRNPVVNIFRVTNTLVSFTTDAWFLVVIDFDSTGLEHYQYSVNVREYQYATFPGTITYPITYQLPLTFDFNATSGLIPISLLTPSSGWTVGQTIDGQWLINEIFTIPGTW